MNAEENIKKLNLILPKAADPVGSYVQQKSVANYYLCLDKFQ